MTESPIGQRYHPQEMFEIMTDEKSYNAVRICREIGLDRISVNSVTEFGSGQGMGTSALLLAFPNAVIHTIDFHNLLDLSIVNHKRVKFYQGLFTDVLQEGSIPQTDICWMEFMSSHHGFNEANIHLLSNYIQPNKQLVTIGDNYNIQYRKWFTDHFTHFWGNDDLYSDIWLKK